MIISPSPSRPSVAATPLATSKLASNRSRTPSPPFRRVPSADATAAYRPARSSPLAPTTTSSDDDGKDKAEPTSPSPFVVKDLSSALQAASSSLCEKKIVMEISHRENATSGSAVDTDAEVEVESESDGASSSSSGSRRSTATVSETESDGGAGDNGDSDDDLPAFESWLSGPNSVAATRSRHISAAAATAAAASGSSARPSSSSMRRSSSHPPPPMANKTSSASKPSSSTEPAAVARPRFPHQAPLRPLPRSLAAMGLKPLSLLPLTSNANADSGSSSGSRSAPSTPSLEPRKGGFNFSSPPNPNMGRPGNANGRTKIIVPSRSKKWSTCFELGLSQQELARME